MSRVCTTCSHPERQSIDARIADKEPYRNIAKRFGINHVSLTRHGTNHVHPVIDSIELQANAAVLKRVMQYRDEVNLPLPEKSKHIENKLWADYDEADKVQDRVAVVKAIAMQQQEQAKLTGAYIKEAANPTDVTSIAIEIVDRLVKQGFEVEEARGMLYKLHPELAPTVSEAVN